MTNDLVIVTQADLMEMVGARENAQGEIEVSFSLHPDPMVMRARILALKDLLMSKSGAHADMPIDHYIDNGLYVRKLFVPAGTVLVGKIHLKGCFNCVESGDITVMTETGVRRLGAGYNQSSPPGIQKVGYAHADTVFVNVFRTDEMDLKEIEAEIACESYEVFGMSIERAEALCQ